jgi:GNAT superfamily N-acetyltransferase
MNNIRYVPITQQLCHAVAELLEVCFPDMLPEDQHSVEELEELAVVFPEGTIIALDGDRVVGMGTGVFLDIDFDNLPSLENELLYTDDVSNHNPDGAYYYGSDMAVHPDYRGRGIGRALYDRRKALVTRYNRRGFVAAAVLPGFAEYKGQLDIPTYVDQVVDGVLFDPTLSMQLRNGFHVVRLIHRFFTFPRSDDWAALICWPNPDNVIADS